VLTKLLPVGLMGAFAAVMLAAFISTHDTYLHSWGSIFIQDVVMPFRKRPFTQEQHLRVLRWSILGVAVFIFLFSWLVQQTQHILLFFAITGSIFSGAGAVIIGGLYTRRGTARGAWSALVTGATVSVGGLLTLQFWESIWASLEASAPAFAAWLDGVSTRVPGECPINGQEFWALGMGLSILVYFCVSVLDSAKPPDLDRVLNRGKHEIAGESEIVDANLRGCWRVFGITPEFTRRDKVIYLITYAWSFSWIGVFLVGTIYSLTHEVPDSAWARYWQIFIWVQVAAAIVVIVWFSIGGLRDVREMTRKLGSMARDEEDDGMVRHQEQAPDRGESV